VDEVDTRLLRRMIAGHAAAARRGLQVRALPAAQDSWAQALELIDLVPDLFDRPPDAVRLRDQDAVRATWAKLRRRWR
jgi:hypothetical protein